MSYHSSPLLVVTFHAIQSTLLCLALLVVILRCWARLHYDRKQLTIAEYFAWLGWLFALGWVICSAIATRLSVEHPPVEPDLTVENVEYLKVVRNLHISVFVAEYLFDTGIYFSKLSLLTFYWLLIPSLFQYLRKALYFITLYLISCMTVSILLNTLISRPISNNWSIEHQLTSAWNSYPNFTTQWGLNFSTDLLLFCFPFFILKYLKLRPEQKAGLLGVFSLGAITLAVSLARFTASVGNPGWLDDATGNTLFTAEMTTAVIVICLPGFKRFFMRSKVSSIKATHSDVSYPSGSAVSSLDTRVKSLSASQAYAEWGVRDDEIELVPGISKESLERGRIGCT
ncbi:hypothetical protein DER45DRAFT_584897 [Fusarium avenaceum]|nr:hypothetical protein DER45DRAFT_584897 [Fusarium avenaceum]